MNTNFLILGVAVILAVLVATMAYTGGFFWLTPVSSATTQISIPTPTPFCTDPDGRNYFYKGTCSDVLGNYTDYCYGNITCNEYYCPTNMSNCTKEPIDCRMVSGSNGVCSNGACQRQQQTVMAEQILVCLEYAVAATALTVIAAPAADCLRKITAFKTRIVPTRSITV
jgi:hypothetical protein